MSDRSIRQYFRFLLDRRATYVQFNKQLLLGELAGFGAGVVVAEVGASIALDDIATSAYSSAADYFGSILGFLAVYYYDQRSAHQGFSRSSKIKKILRNAFKLWPPVLAGDIAFIIARPYFHYVMLVSGIEPGFAATIAHFLAFGIFNCVAIFSRSMIDYARSTRN